MFCLHGTIRGSGTTDVPEKTSDVSASTNVPAGGVPAAPPELATGEPAAVTYASPARLAWRRLRKNRSAMLGAIILIILYATVLFGSFISPHEPSARDYVFTNHPPMLPRFFDEKNQFHARPFFYGMKLVDP